MGLHSALACFPLHLSICLWHEPQCSLTLKSTNLSDERFCFSPTQSPSPSSMYHVGCFSLFCLLLSTYQFFYFPLSLLKYVREFNSIKSEAWNICQKSIFCQLLKIMLKVSDCVFASVVTYVLPKDGEPFGVTVKWVIIESSFSTWPLLTLTPTLGVAWYKQSIIDLITSVFVWCLSYNYENVNSPYHNLWSMHSVSLSLLRLLCVELQYMSVEVGIYLYADFNC